MQKKSQNREYLENQWRYRKSNKILTGLLKSGVVSEIFQGMPCFFKNLQKNREYLENQWRYRKTNKILTGFLKSGVVSEIFWGMPCFFKNLQKNRKIANISRTNGDIERLTKFWQVFWSRVWSRRSFKGCHAFSKICKKIAKSRISREPMEISKD